MIHTWLMAKCKSKSASERSWVTGIRWIGCRLETAPSHPYKLIRSIKDPSENYNHYGYGNTISKLWRVREREVHTSSCVRCRCSWWLTVMSDFSDGKTADDESVDDDSWHDSVTTSVSQRISTMHFTLSKLFIFCFHNITTIFTPFNFAPFTSEKWCVVTAIKHPVPDRIKSSFVGWPYIYCTVSVSGLQALFIWELLFTVNYNNLL